MRVTATVWTESGVQHQKGVLNVLARAVRPLEPARTLTAARSHDYA